MNDTKLSGNALVRSIGPISSSRDSVMSVLTLLPECTKLVAEQHISRKLQGKHTVDLVAKRTCRLSPILLQLLDRNGCNGELMWDEEHMLHV